jgi:small GTP-binding protein
MSVEIIIIGETNDGKTTVVSNLIEDEDAIIGPDPGTTRKAHQHRLYDRNGQLLFEVWDTPGFEETDEMHYWFTTQAGKGIGDLAQGFIREYADNPAWQRDIELMRPIQDGAIVVYVAASNRRPIEDDRKQLEIIRLTGAVRVALINQKPGEIDYTKEWITLLQREIGAVDTYQPMTAGIRERLSLLDTLARCCIGSRDEIHKVRDALEADWNARLEDLARMMLDTLRKVMQCQAGSRVGEAASREKLNSKLLSLEERFRRDAKQLFRHRKASFNSAVLDAPLTSTEMWKSFGLGLTKVQAIAASAIMGAGVGAFIDASVGGLSLLTGTLIGGATGTFLGASLVYSPVAASFGDNQVITRVQPKSNLPNVLMDRLLIFGRLLIRISHGARSEEALRIEVDVSEDASNSRLRNWSSGEREAFAKLVAEMAKANPSEEKLYGASREKVLAAIVRELEV